MDFLTDDFYVPNKINLNDFIADIGNLSKISSMEILDRISLLNKNDRKLVLSDNLIKEKLRIGLLSESRDNQWYYYREILNKISPVEFLYLYDAEFLNKYFEYHQGEYMYRFWASLCEKNINDVVDFIVEYDKLLNIFLKESDNFESLFENLNYTLLLKILYKLQEVGSDFHYDFLSSINKEYQYLLLQEDKIKDNTLVHLINSFYYEVKSYFFKNDKRALYLYDRFDIPFLCKAGVQFSDNLLKKSEFFDMLKDKSLIVFRTNIDNVERCNNPIWIESKVDEYYRSILSLYSSEYNMFSVYKQILDNPGLIVNLDKNVSYLFNYDIIDKLMNMLRMDNDGNYSFDNKNELELFMINETSKKMSEVIIDHLFKDNIYNVWLNIKEMIRYNNGLNTDKKILDNDKVCFYKSILDFDNLSNINKLSFYNSFKNKNVSLMFYEDLKMVKEYAYDRIKEDLFNVNTVIDKSFNNNGVKIYDARNIEYNMLVRTQSQYREDSHYRRNCYSIISNENTSVFGEQDYNSFLYGYNSFDNEMVLHMFESDSFSSGFKEKTSRYVNRIMTIKELVLCSYSYNEVQLLNKKKDGQKHKYNVKKPNFIVVFDTIRDIHIEEAKRLNIPIVIIKKQALEKDMNLNIAYDMNTYVENIYDENENRIRR